MDDDKHNAPSDFVPIRDEHGKPRGIMDRVTADYFASKASNPRQADLEAVLSRVTRVRIIKHERQTATELIPEQVLIDTVDPDAIAELRTCLLIRDSGGHVMTFGMESMELIGGEEVFARINLICTSILRWNAWKNDATLIDPMPFKNWLARNGAPQSKMQ